MRPYGSIRRIRHFPGKVDGHCHDSRHRKLGTWWEGYSDTVPRSTMRLLLKRQLSAGVL